MRRKSADGTAGTALVHVDRTKSLHAALNIPTAMHTVQSLSLETKSVTDWNTTRKNVDGTAETALSSMRSTPTAGLMRHIISKMAGAMESSTTTKNASGMEAIALTSTRSIQIVTAKATAPASTMLIRAALLGTPLGLEMAVVMEETIEAWNVTKMAGTALSSTKSIPTVMLISLIWSEITTAMEEPTIPKNAAGMVGTAIGSTESIRNAMWIIQNGLKMMCVMVEHTIPKNAAGMVEIATERRQRLQRRKPSHSCFRCSLLPLSTLASTGRRSIELKLLPFDYM